MCVHSPGARRGVCLLVAFGVVGCNSPGALLMLSSTPTAATPAYCVSLGAGGERRYGARFSSANATMLPQTLGVSADGHASATARLDGIAATGLTVESVAQPINFGSAVADVPLALDTCMSNPATGAFSSNQTPIPISADRLAIVRSGAEVAGGAELVALGASDGARYRYANGVLDAQAGAALANGAGTAVSTLTSFDVDGDCADDLLVAAGAPPSVWPSAKDGDLALDGSRVPSAIGVTAARAQAAGDVSGDGWADLVVVGDDGGAVLLSDRVRGFVSTQNGFSLDPTMATTVALADLDGDQLLDAIVGFQGAPLLWYHGDGAGNFIAQPALSGGATANQIIARDLDGDGNIDLVVSAAQGGLFVFRNQGGGVFVEDTASELRGTIDANLVGLVAADLDGDCSDDFIALGTTQPPAWLKWVGGTFTVQPQAFGPQATAGAAGDLDGDGHVEVALVEAGRVVVYDTVGR